MQPDTHLEAELCTLVGFSLECRLPPKCAYLSSFRILFPICPGPGGLQGLHDNRPSGDASRRDEAAHIEFSLNELNLTFILRSITTYCSEARFLDPRYICLCSLHYTDSTREDVQNPQKVM